MPVKPPQIPFEGVLGCGFLQPDGEGQWHNLPQGPGEAEGLTALRIGSETFRVVRMYRLKLHRLRLSTPSGALFLATDKGITVALLLGDDASGAAGMSEVWTWLEAWLGRLEVVTVSGGRTD